jgi:hypothetical protein
MHSTGRTSTRNSPEYNDEKSKTTVDIDYTQNSDAYFSLLTKIQKNAVKVRQKDSDQEKTLMEYLPVNEKFNLNKEGKVLARWQERQRDWERIQSSISKKLGSKSIRPLMMTTTDEYRARIEEYDLIQAALPLKDRYSENSWQMTLRGGGPICIAIGHIFSGIECKVDVNVPKPKMIRKPKPTENTFKNDTFLEQTDSLTKKRKKYEKSLTEIRPHNLTYSDASNLVVRSTNLFVWARESSAQFFVEQQEDLLLSLREQEEENDDNASAISASERRSVHSLNAGDMEVADERSSAPRVELSSSREVVFDTVVGKDGFRSVSFRNTGSVVVSYRWRRVSLEKSEKDKKGRPEAADVLSRAQSLTSILTSKGTDGGALRTHVISQQRECFYCLVDSGEALPDESISTVFSFSGQTGPGLFRSSWVLEFTPFDTGINVPTTTSGEDSAQKLVGSVGFTLRAHCLEPDESVSSRAAVLGFVNARATESMARDIIQNCIRRVRIPVRLSDLQSRQVLLFREINAPLLSALGDTRYPTLLPLFVTPQRMDAFADIVGQSALLFTEVTELISSLWQIDTGNASVSNNRNPFRVTASAAQEIRQRLFPEKLIVSIHITALIMLFDSLSFSAGNFRRGGGGADRPRLELRPDRGPGGAHRPAGGGTAGTSAGGAHSRGESRYCSQDTIEWFNNINSFQRDLLATKERLREEKRAARKLAANDSDEEEEEEEEQEEEDEDAALRVKPPHALHVRVEMLQFAIQGGLNALVCRPVDADMLFNTARTAVTAITERFNDWRSAALSDAGLLDLVNSGVSIPPLLSPFATREGADAWTHALKQTSPIAEPVAPVKGAPKPPKNAPLPTGPTKQQTDFFYRQLYGSVREGLLAMADALFGEVNGALVETAATTDRGEVDMQVIQTSLFDVSVVRADDMSSSSSVAGQGAVAFVSIDGDAFTRADSVFSAFDVAQRNKAVAVQPISKLIELGAKAIVVVYEPTSASDGDIVSQFEQIQALVNAQREEYITARNKELKKLKRSPPTYKVIKFLSCKSFAELNHRLDVLLRYGEFSATQKQSSSAEVFFAGTIPVVLLQGVSFPGVVPDEPPFVEVDSDDDEAPISVGLEENASRQRAQWIARRPHRVSVDIDAGAGSRLTVQCYADAAASIKEAASLAANQGDEVLWVDGAADRVFASDALTALRGLFPTVGERFVAEGLRDSLMWAGVVQLLPVFTEHLSTNSPLAQHLGRVFPVSASRGAKPHAVAVLGGHIRSDKFRVFDQLIETVSGFELLEYQTKILIFSLFRWT